VVHKEECKACIRWAKNSTPAGGIPGDAIRCLGRLLWTTKVKGSGSVWVSAGFGGIFGLTRNAAGEGDQGHAYEIYQRYCVCILIGFGRPTCLQGLARRRIRASSAVNCAIHGARGWKGIGAVWCTLE